MNKRFFVISSFLVMLLLIFTPMALAQSPTITVSGMLINKTTGEPAPAGIPLMLHTFDNDQMSGMIDGVTAEDGSFIFENVEAPANRLFEMMATVGKTSYFSDVAPAPTDGGALELPVNYFDATTDASGLRVTQMHMIVDFFSPSLLQIAEIYIISNDSDKTVEDAVQLPDGNTAAVQFDLPKGAVNLSFDQGQIGDRFLETETGFADTFGIQPGAETGQIIVRYYIPYKDGVTVDHPLSYPTERVNVLLPEVGVKLTSDKFGLDSTREIADGRTVEIYASGDMSTSPNFAFRLNGEPQLGQNADIAEPTVSVPISGTDFRVIGFGILLAGALVLAVGVWWWKRNPVDNNEPVDGYAIPVPTDLPADSPENEIVQALLDLDAALDAGTITEQAYERQRETLRDDLKAVLLRRQKPTVPDTVVDR